MKTSDERPRSGSVRRETAGARGAPAGSTRDVSQYFSVKEVDNSFKQAIPRRKPPVRPIWNMTAKEADEIRLKAFEKWDLAEFADCWTFELRKRPVPFVSTDDRPKRVAEVFKMYIQDVLAVLVPEMVPHIQVYNKVSRLGCPINANPVDEDGRLLKMDLILEYFKYLDDGDISPWSNSYYTLNTRLQNEEPTKEREMQFISSDGKLYSELVDRRAYRDYLPELGREAIPPRTRGVFCPALINLYLQVWDTMLHRAIMRHPLCDANVYTREEVTSTDDWGSFDCKHYERYLGMLVEPYAQAIGGRYEAWMMKMLHDPYLVPSDDWKKCFLIKPLYGPGVYPQFGSGLCNVSTLGKLANICVTVHYFVTLKKLSRMQAVLNTLSGSYESLRRWMYGDDNRIRGPACARDEYTEFVSDYFEITLDNIATYLGTVLRPDIRRFVLPRRTYNLKLYQPERDFSFKAYPALGLVKRRETFITYGEPEIGSEIIPYEDELFASVSPDNAWPMYVHAAHREEMEARARGQAINAYAVTDKEYLLTDEQALASGQFYGLPLERTRTIVHSLVGPHIKSKLKF